MPFISRYRKEATGSLDEVEITSIRDRLDQLVELDKRREAILASLIERDLLTDDLNEQILAAETMAELEDIYLPFRPKRRARATIAREKGLEALAQMILAQDDNPPIDPEAEAMAFVNEEKGVASAEEALAGARDIIAEVVNEDIRARTHMRELYASSGAISTSVVKDKEEEGANYRDYFDWRESVTTAPSHRVLAMLRGENEGYLRLHISPSQDEALELLGDMFVRGKFRHRIRSRRR